MDKSSSTGVGEPQDSGLAWSDDLYEKALQAEPQLQVLARMVAAFVALAPSRRSKRPMCAGCIWESILKPLVRPWVGWERGYAPKPAMAQPRAAVVLDLRSWLGQQSPRSRPHPDNEVEAWLRSSEAFDVVTDRWLNDLRRADPGHGHGIPRSQ